MATGAIFYKLADSSFDSTKIQVGPMRRDIVTECANLCLLGFREDTNMVRRPLNGVCTGFAIDEDLCTLLYPQDGGKTAPYKVGAHSRLYSVDGCA